MVESEGFTEGVMALFKNNHWERDTRGHYIKVVMCKNNRENQGRRGKYRYPQKELNGYNYYVGIYSADAYCRSEGYNRGVYTGNEMYEGYLVIHDHGYWETNKRGRIITDLECYD